jgi:hypothetical protein
VARRSGESVVVEMEDAVKLLVEYLVLPALPHGRLNLEEALMPEKQETLARQVRIGFSVAQWGFAGGFQGSCRPYGRAYKVDPDSNYSM